MMPKYIEQLAEQAHRATVWRSVSLVSLGLNLISAATVAVLALSLIDAKDKVEYILVPGIPQFTIVRPGEIPDSYVEQGFLAMTNYLNGWTYETIRDNYKFLFKKLYAKSLIDRTRASFNAQAYFENVEKEKIVSLWRYVPEESEFHWCGDVKIDHSAHGVACGIVTGYQTRYRDNNIPNGREKISYLIYATSVMPSPSDPFALQFTRIRRGPLKVLQSELAESLTRGVLPPEDDHDF